MSAWKIWEDTCAKALGGRRVLGNRGSGVPDSDEDVPFALECKLGFGRYSLRDAWIEQARKNATSTGKRVGNPSESVIVGKAGFGLVPGAEIDGKVIHRPPITPGRGMAVYLN